MGLILNRRQIQDIIDSLPKEQLDHIDIYTIYGEAGVEALFKCNWRGNIFYMIDHRKKGIYRMEGSWNGEPFIELPQYILNKTIEKIKIITGKGA